jgi:hypothetical protein
MMGGNNSGYGVNPKADRVYQVVRGVLYATAKGETDPQRAILTVQAGGVFKAPKGLEYSVATSTEDTELLIIEDVNYAKTWQPLEEGVASNAATSLPGAAVDNPLPVRRKQSKAKEQAVAQARSRGRAANTSPVGVSRSQNANSVNVDGVNPMPAGAGAYRDDD